MQEIYQADSLNDLYLFQGEVHLKPKGYIGFLVVSVFEKISIFFGYTTKYSLEEKVVDLLASQKDVAASADKVQSLALSKHFNLKKKAEGEFKDPFEKTMVKAELAWTRGKKKLAGGSTGSAYFVFDPSGGKQPLGVFKTEKERSYWVRFVLFVKSFFGQRRLLDQREGAEARCEAASHTLHKYMKIDTTPVTKEATFAEDSGSFQAYVEVNASEADKEAWYAKESYTEEEKHIFQKYAFGSFLSGDLDANRENTLLELNEKKELVHIWSIDNANTFPEHLAEKGWILSPPKNQYAWAREEIASFPFDERMKKWIKNVVDSEDQALKDLNSKAKLSSLSKKRLRERFAVLRKKLEGGEFSPADLLPYACKSEVRAFLASS